MANKTDERTKLTKKQIDAASYRGDGTSRDVRWDIDPIGLGLRIYPSGKKSFILKYRTPTGRSRMMTLGAYGVLTLEEARIKARRELVKVIDGGDPLSDRKAASSAETFKKFAETWLERHAKPHRRSWKEDKRRLDNRIVPVLGHLAVKDVKRADVAALHASIGKDAPIEANRVLELVRAMLFKAEAWGYLPEGTPNPAAKVKRFKERKRDRFVTPAEMPRLVEKINADPNVYVRAALMLYLLTGLRKNELLRAKWADVDLDARTWTIPKTKQDEPHTVPLSAPAVAILEGLPRLSGNPHVFPGHKRGTHLVNIAKNWRNVRVAAECEDVTLHDLRRTVGSWMASSGVSLAIVGQVLGHAPGDVAATAIYARLQQASARKALDDHGAALLEVINGKPKVDPLKDRLAKLMADPDADPAEVAAALRALAERLEVEATS
jgi:integrase